MTANRSAAHDSLRGLALGDAFGERWFPLFRPPQDAYRAIQARQTPSESPWPWTDDTAMALGLMKVLSTDGMIEQGRLAHGLGSTFLADPARGYASGMHELLPVLAHQPATWREAAGGLFGGQGSFGNGAAMRVAPLGAWFSDDLDQVVEQATRSAEVTHRHPDGIAGAVAVALAAAHAARRRQPAPEPVALLQEVADGTPSGAVRSGLVRAGTVPGDTPPWRAADILGNGQRVSAADTVPFALWCAAWHLDDLVDTLWTTAEGLGDVDTTCAISAGVTAARTGLAAVPDQWLDRCEPLPSWTATLTT